MSFPIVTLGDVAEIEMGQAPAGDSYNVDGDGVPLIAGASDFGPLTPQPSRYTDAPTKLSQSGDIILCVRATIGDLNLSDTAYCLGRGVAGLRPKTERLDQRYLWRVLEANAATLRSKGRGATFLQVSKSDISGLLVPLPPVPEQRRIAGILDQADALRRLRTRALEKLNTLGQAVFQEMFGDPRANPKKWEIGTIGDLLSEANYGTSEKANADGNGLPILRMGNITYDGRIDLTDLKHIELQPRDFDKYTTKRGDILFNRTNSKELVGKTAVVRLESPMAIAGYLVRARTNSDGNPDYISAYLNSHHGKATLMNMCNNIIGMANINAKEMQRIKIALPPRSLQDIFSDRLEAMEPLRKEIESSLAASSSLFASLQHRAFRGEL